MEDSPYAHNDNLMDDRMSNQFIERLIDRLFHQEAIKETGKTSRDRVYAGGDIITGGSTVISAMGQARIAAAAMHEYMMSVEPIAKGS